ncbi:phosphoinositide phosphatase SAC2 isoform X2 [Impatiens glandulifera]|uniref:phosphoinositide phosphatase SAC2 isoform X2 n=1 Tax=Impatiens glandulifera TaxID=253017 RepID=UPI001FB16EDB|nr:phosphoinositide phosphatase SAC2 isoform X2 [Impatiens glandulifera]
MGTENVKRTLTEEEAKERSYYLQKFRLYETRSNFYMIGRDKNRNVWRVLKIDRLDSSELNIHEDSTIYSQIECYDLLRRIHEGNKKTGGLKFVTTCYGIVGIIKFLGPYYMLLITKRRKIGIICGHAIYEITKRQMIPIPNSTARSKMDFSKNENRYKKLLFSVDLTKDFYFSYSYHVMQSLQRNLCNHESGNSLYETMFVWNGFLTRGIRNQLKNTLWTVPLVYGFFKQVKLSLCGKDFILTLMARRSRHYAGTRYLKRGVNEKGRVANDVETEQIVIEDAPEGCPTKISSIVQIRGSIPLFWSQETSRLNIKPDIILSRKDLNYEATRLHFENLVKRYGKPIIILNLIKRHEKKPRESVLRTEFANAIESINKDLAGESRLKFLHWDLSKHSKKKATDALWQLGKVASNALNLTGIFYCQMTPTSGTERLQNYSCMEEGNSEVGVVQNVYEIDNSSGMESRGGDNISTVSGNYLVKQVTLQKGVLRTNCIDCLDRTNVAQYAFGLMALGHQLQAIGISDDLVLDLDTPLADDLMTVYESMGDTLALQYGGSAAHNKIFSERRGQWRAATQSQELFRTLQRYYSNAYMDAVKQDAINVFLGYFQPQLDKPALWELDSDQHYSIGRQSFNISDGTAARSFIKRSLSDGNILCETDSAIEASIVGESQDLCQHLVNVPEGGNIGLSESSPEISTCEADLSCPRRRLFPDVQLDPNIEVDNISLDEQSNCSNFLDMDWLSSSGNSCEEDTFEKSIDTGDGVSSDNIIPAPTKPESTVSASECGSSGKSSNFLTEYSDNFIQWVVYGEMLWP